MLMWSTIAISDPGPTAGRSDPAALVSTRISAPAARRARTGVRSASGSPPSYRCARPWSTATGTPAIEPSTARPRKARQLLIADHDRVLHGVGDRAQARSEHDAHAWRSQVHASASRSNAP